MNTSHKLVVIAVLGAVASSLSGCANISAESVKEQAKVAQSIKDAPAPVAAPVITKTSGAWLMGQAVKVAAPVAPGLRKHVAYHAEKVTLAEIASYISQETGLIVDVSEVQSNGNTGSTGGAQQAGAMQGVQGMQGMVSPQPMGMSAPGSTQGALQPISIVFEGTYSGLLDVAASKWGIWWKPDSLEKVIFFRSETKTFYLPTNAGKAVGNSTISTSAGASGSGMGGTNATGGATSTSDYTVDFWADLAVTAKTVASNAPVAINPSAGSVTVTGTPAQVRAIEEWVKNLSEQLSQQVAVTMDVYSVKLTDSDTYNWSPSVVFKQTAGAFGYTLSPPTALIPVNGATPASIAASVLNTATGWKAQYTGTQVAFQALSTLGKVTQSFHRTAVTMNGRVAPMQVANQRGYMQSSATVLTPNVGSTTTLTPGTVTTGITATFLPRINNGKVSLDMTMTNSSLLGLGTVSSGTSTIQTPNVDLSTFQQSVSLVPGDALLLTGLQNNNISLNNSGVGSATNMLFGGGVNNSTDKTMIAIVISVKVL